MPTYKAPVEDALFLLNDVFQIERYNNLPGFADATPDIVEAILDGGRQALRGGPSPRSTGSATEEGCTRQPDGSRHDARPASRRPTRPMRTAAGWASRPRPNMAARACPTTLNAVDAGIRVLGATWRSACIRA